jgi:LysR family transcriptional regulator, transcriptional activator of nhaA
MAELNFHHLRYFWTIAQEQNMTRAAARVHVSPSALSIQLRQLEERLGHALFERRNGRLHLTEAGRLALAHADTIFKAGQELVATLQGRPRAQLPRLRVGSVATLSRNFQLAWLRPLLQHAPGPGQVQIQLHSGRLPELLAQLAAHQLDVVLANEAAPTGRADGWYSRLLAQQPLSVVSGRPGSGHRRLLPFPQGLQGQTMLLPGAHSAVRTAFDAVLQQADVQVEVLAEADDMAMLRVMARETGVLTLVPAVVVQDELAAGVLVERCRIPQITERFYAITGQRRFPHPLLKTLMLPGA